MPFTSPYINTKLYSLIPLKADQMDNKIYLNLKQNLEKKLLNKCYKNYGIITHIYQISEYGDGIIEAENFSSSAIFEAEFSCRLCAPLNGTEIICEIVQLTKLLITAQNGPILVAIPNMNISDKVFMLDNRNNYVYNKDGVKTKLEKNDFVKVRIIQLQSNNGDTQIIAIGTLIDIATTEEINKHYKDLYDKEKEIVNITDYQNQDLSLLYD